MIGESMFYLENDNTDLIMGDPLEIDAIFIMADEAKEEANGKDQPKDKSSKEDGVEGEEVVQSKEEEGAEESLIEESDIEPAEELAETKTKESTEEETLTDVEEEVDKSKANELVEEVPAESQDFESIDIDHVAGEVAESSEVSDREPAIEEKTSTKKIEDVTEAQADEPSAEEASSEEMIETKGKIPIEEEAPSDEVAEKKEEEPAKPKLDSEEVVYIAQQTKIVQATYFEMRKDLPKFRSGDKVSVGYRVIEGGRSRIQNFEGVVIKISAGHGMDKTFTVRKVSGGIGVERIFPLHSPNIKNITVLKEGKVRRAMLYYLRSRVGKATRIKERTSQ